jgi:hypothetical protein
VTARYLFVCSTLLLFANGADGSGMYQHTRDGRTFVWNDHPTRDDEAMWSGDRDSNGYATGNGTLTWYKVQRAVETGSNIPSSTGRIVGAVVTSRYSGKMVRGKFQGAVVNVGAHGKVFHGTSVNGTKAADWVAASLPQPNRPPNQNVSKSAGNAEPAPPAAGPPRLAVVAPAQSLVPSSTPSVLSSNPEAIETAVKNRMIADFKEQTQSVLSRVGDATGNFHEVDQFNSVPQLPTPLSESVSSLVDRGRDFRAKLGYETALSECRAETETVDALLAIDQATRSIADKNASDASARLADFLKNNPEAIADAQKPLWRYLSSMQQLCSRMEKEAEAHSQRAAAFASVGKPGDAILEYREAYRIFPNPATAEKIRQLQRNSLGL